MSVCADPSNTRRRRGVASPRWKVRLARLAPTLLAFAVIRSVAAEPPVAPVYKCPQADGVVLYADYPCKGGSAVDIRPGAPAPDASERLARARDELDRSAARRQAIDEAAALRRDELNQRRRELEAARLADSAAYAADLSYLPAYGYYPQYVKARPHRSNARPPSEAPRVVSDRRVPAVIRRP